MNKTPEEWARHKGMAFLRVDRRDPITGRLAGYGEACAVLVGAMHHNKWAHNDPLSEERFDAGVQAFNEEPLP